MARGQALGVFPGMLPPGQELRELRLDELLHALPVQELSGVRGTAGPAGPAASAAASLGVEAETAGEDRTDAAPLKACVVTSGPSRLARYLEARIGNVSDPGEALEACLADLVDSVLQAEHALSERRRPRAFELTAATSPTCRVELLTWMVESFDIMQFDDTILHSVALTLDRYYATRTSKIEDAKLQPLVLSALCVELKTTSALEFPENAWKRYLEHLCQGRIAISEILLAEAELLTRLGYTVGVPTPLDFLRGLLVIRRGHPLVAQLLSLGTFLLELALFDMELEYGYEHTLLAAGALSAAFRALGLRSPTTEIAEQLLSYWPVSMRADAEIAKELVLKCEQALLVMWLRCSQCETRGFYTTLQAKFAQGVRFGVSRASPACALAHFLQYQQHRALETWDEDLDTTDGAAGSGVELYDHTRTVFQM